MGLESRSKGATGDGRGAGPIGRRGPDARGDPRPRPAPRWAAVAWLRYYLATDRLARDFDGALRDGAQIRAWVADWPNTLDRIRRGHPPVAIASWAGRPGRERTMSAQAIHLAARSLALHPKAREEQNRERAAGYRGPSALGRGQRGHKHSQTARARGVARADQLAAEEACHEGFRVSSQTVEKARRDLRRILGEL